jgi:fatty-acyl-CoA synthase
MVLRNADLFDRSADIHPDRAAVVEGTTKFTYREVQQFTNRFAAALYANGFKRQEAIALYSPNHHAVLLCLQGLWRAGGTWVPVNTRNAMDANIAYMNYVRVRWLFYHSQYADDVRKLMEGVPTIKHVICIDKTDNGHTSLDAFLKTGDGKQWTDTVDCFGNLDELVGIFPTGGTTGPAKGACVTNLGWGTMMEITSNAWRVKGLDHSVCLVTAPLTHAAGPVSTAAFVLGATNVIMAGFDAKQVLENIEKYRVTHLYLPPTALYLLLDHPDLGKHDYSSLKIFVLVGSPVSGDKLKRAVEVFGPCMCQCYGQVESPLITTWLPPETVAAAAAGDHPERLKSCGLPTYPVRVGIMDDEGNLLPPGRSGEIVVRGSLVTHSYFEKPDATAETHRDGWHHTGDVAYRDKDGYLYIVDRKKDMVVTGGFNVFTAEVEDTIMELNSVAECAVIGVPHDKWGEAVKAICVPANGASPTEDEVIAHTKARLGGVKAPKSVEFWKEIPKTANNKMDKKAIRKRFWADAERNVH